MPNRERERERPVAPGWVVATGVVLMAATLVVDLALPLGVAAAVAYVVPVLLGLWAPGTRYALTVAVAATILCILAVALKPAGDSLAIVLVNRTFALFGIWSGAFVVQWHGRLRRDYRDIEEEAHVTLRELHDFKRALDQSSIVAITDQRGIIKYVNDKFCEISKYPAEELIGQDHRILNSGAHPKEFMRDLWRTIASGRVWRGEIKNRAKDGTHYWVDTTIVPFLDDRDKPFQYVAIRNDITERKLAQERLAQQAALARLGEMAAVVAHEVKNPLAGIGGALRVIGGRLPEGGEDRRVVGDMQARLDALDRMATDLLVFARPRPLRRGPVELLPLARRAADLLARDPAHARVEIAVRGSNVVLEADGKLLEDVLLNLVMNASQAMGGVGRVQLEVLPDGSGGASLAVVDTGPGIPEAVRERIFEPFFTTKSRGTGLGLAIARRVVEAHGGRIEVTDTPGGGATLKAHLPGP